MTRDRDFKSLVRARAAERGLTYMQALAELRAEGVRDDAARDPFVDCFDAVVDTVAEVLAGKRDVIRLVVTALVAGGHVLLDDVPGTGKTLLARGIGAAFGGTVSRVKATPDVDRRALLGTAAEPGWLFHNVVVVEDVTKLSTDARTTLLEVVSTGACLFPDGAMRAMPSPSLLLASRRPYADDDVPLDEDLCDRFLFGLSVGYAAREVEARLVARPWDDSPIDRVERDGRVVDERDLAAMRARAAEIEVPAEVEALVLAIVEATRNDPRLRVGASPRASIGLVRAATVLAAAAGRDAVVPDDVLSLASPVLAHRLVPTPDAVAQGDTGTAAVERAIAAATSGAAAAS